MKKPAFHSTHITHHSDGSHTVEHTPHMKKGGSSAFMERGEGKSYSASNGPDLMKKMGEHLGLKGIEESAGGEGDGGEME